MGCFSLESGRWKSEELVVIIYEDGLWKFGIDFSGEVYCFNYILYLEDYDDMEEIVVFEL